MADLMLYVNGGGVIFVLAALAVVFFAGVLFQSTRCSAAMGRMDARHAKQRGELRRYAEERHTNQMREEE
jgi:hypothetical protein